MIYNRINNEKVLFTISFIIILIYFLPYVILGENSSLLVRDNMDSNVVWVKMLLDSGKMFANPLTSIDQVFNGVPRSSFYGYDISLLWFKIGGMYWGYVINKFLMAVVGFWGMYLLLKNHFLPKNVFKVIPFGVAVLFALLPFWSFTMTVCGLPLLLFAFLNIRKHNNQLGNWLIIIIFPFYSSLILSGVFFLLVVTSILIYDVIKTRIINYRFFFAIALLSAIYVVSHFPLFYALVYGSHVSHRVEFQDKASSLANAIKQSYAMFVYGKYHAFSVQRFILIPIAFGLCLMFIAKKLDKAYLMVLAFVIFTSLFYGFLSWGFIFKINEKLMDVLPINIERFHFLHPMFFYVLLGLSLALIANRIKFGKFIVVAVLILQLGYVALQHEVFVNRNKPSFRQFYAEEQFNEVKSFINRPQQSYRVISVGMHPAVAQYNGFYTLDGYFADYPLIYKHQFRKVILGELDKKKAMKDEFDFWGSHCYAFSAEVFRNYINLKPKKITNLAFNFVELKKMGGEYLISYTEIETEGNLSLLKIFKDRKSYWTIYLYKVL